MARPEELEEDAVKRAVVVAKKSNVPIVVCGPTLTPGPSSTPSPSTADGCTPAAARRRG